MQRVSIDDPAWLATFPHIVAPLPDEWLPGLLLRCDEVNDWRSGMTLSHIRHSPRKPFINIWHEKTHQLFVVVPNSLNLDSLAQLLATPTSTLLHMTYFVELTRLYDSENPPSRSLHLNPSFPFRVCPECLAQDRLLRRTLVLRYITVCPQHQINLVEKCDCGVQLKLFNRHARPFTCHACSLDWEDLPQYKPHHEVLVRKQKLLIWYEFFFSNCTPEMLWNALNLALPRRSDSTWKIVELDQLVPLLVDRGISPSDF